MPLILSSLVKKRGGSDKASISEIPKKGHKEEKNTNQIGESPPLKDTHKRSIKTVVKAVAKDLNDNDESDLEEEVAKYNKDDWPKFPPPPYRALPSVPPFTALVTNPHQQLLDKIQSIKEQIKLEKEHQDVIRQFEALKIGRVEKSSSKIKPENQTTPPEQLKPPIKGATLKAQIRQDNLSVPSETEAFPVTETTDAQGQAWRHHNGFDFKVIKEIKLAVAQYGATAPYSMAIVESVAENWLTPGDWRSLAHATLSGGDYLLWK